ncbi:hypothetical protein [Microbacterium salsuginis]|uniref:hypothetical protein n=1 Tax=Microbacterium salsuginis TaxID=2722803 RepID=UPI00197CA5D2|nr:hypothetical protein [Microbacterium sp. CFH 90308]
MFDRRAGVPLEARIALRRQRDTQGDELALLSPDLALGVEHSVVEGGELSSHLAGELSEGCGVCSDIGLILFCEVEWSVLVRE